VRRTSAEHVADHAENGQWPNRVEDNHDRGNHQYTRGGPAEPERNDRCSAGHRQIRKHDQCKSGTAGRG
jgi:hypothetical protein